jgi:hypothetical protein
MIVNNLLLKLKEKDHEDIAKARDVLLSMKGKIEVLSDFDAYLVHPVHVEVSRYISRVLESGAAVCYESKNE